MPNLYASLQMLKDELRDESTSQDSVLERVLEAVSRGMDAQLGRHFYHRTATMYFNGNGRRRLLLHEDLLTVTTLKADEDGDSTYERTLAVNTDYWLYRSPDLANTPYRAIDINPYKPLIAVWPLGRRRVELAGVWGYSNETEASGTLNGAIANATTTTVTMAAGHGISVGHTIIVESEQMYVSAVATNTLTVVRGVNGTTAADHADLLAVTRRRFPRDLERAVLMQGARVARETRTGYSAATGGVEAGFQVSSAYPMIRDLVEPYRILAVA